MPFRLRRTAFVAAAVISASALALVGCSAGGATPTATETTAVEPVAGGTLVFGGLATQALDPGVATFSSQSRPWVMPVYSSLFWVNPDSTAAEAYLPGLASGYEYSDDNLTLTIELRDGLKFSDGTDLDADAVVWNFQRHIENKTREAQFFYNTDADHITAVDPTHVQIEFTAPNPLLLDAMAVSSTGFISSPTAFEQLGEDTFNAQPVGAGPFMITSVDPGNEIQYVKNPEYWDAANVYLDGITWLNTGADASAWMTNLQSGAIQAVNLNGQTTSPAVFESVKGDSSLRLIDDGQALNVLITPTNTTKAPFDDIRARQAVAYCTDRESIASNTLQGYAVPAYVLSGTTSIALSDWEEGKALNPLQYDVDKGTELVDDLGGLTFSVITNQTSPVLTALQQQWAECGIQADIVIDGAYLDKVKAGDYEIEIERGMPAQVTAPGTNGQAAGEPAATMPAAAISIPGPAGPGLSPGGRGASGVFSLQDMDMRIPVLAPLVGTMYRQAQPGSKPFAEVGDVIEAGQTVCIVEAMKLMNEVAAAEKGKVAEILVDNGDWVEFEQVLMYLEPAD